MQKEINLVIPLGNGDPRLDVPNEKLLIRRLEQVKAQTIPIKLTLAIDSNLRIDKLAAARSYADEIVSFGNDSYFAPGGIWNKIYACWEKSDCPYVAWQGYDDYSSNDRFTKQLARIKETNANSCVCQNWVANPDGTKLVHTGNVDFLQYLHRHMPYMGSFLIKRDTILNSGIAAYRNKWSYYFEGLLYTFILGDGRPAVSGGDFIYYTHPATIANTGKEQHDWVKLCRQNTGYTEENCISDWNSIPFAQLNSDVIRKWQLNGW